MNRNIRLADGTELNIEFGRAAHRFVVNDHGAPIAVFHVTGDDLRRLCSLPGVESCGNCKFGRVDSNNVTRCHLNPPRKRGDERFFPRMEPDAWCGRYRAVRPLPPAPTEPREPANESDAIEAAAAGAAS